MDPEFWYQQHNFDSDAHHLNNYMIDMAQKYMRRDATRMETYIDFGAAVYEFKHGKGIFARIKLTMEAIRSMHADFYNSPDDTRYNASANIKILEEEVTINDCEQSLQTISPILSSEGTDTQCIQKAPTASIHQCGTLLRLCYCGVLRAGATPAMSSRTRVPVTRSEATAERWMGAARTTRRSRRSGAGPTGGGPEQEDRGRIRADDVYPDGAVSGASTTWSRRRGTGS
jgi:hypothetical protein